MDEETEKIQAQEIRDIRGSRLQKFARILSGRWELILEVLSGNLIHGGSTVIACCDCTNHISITEKIKEARDEVETHPGIPPVVMLIMFPRVPAARRARVPDVSEL